MKNSRIPFDGQSDILPLATVASVASVEELIADAIFQVVRERPIQTDNWPALTCRRAVTMLQPAEYIRLVVNDCDRVGKIQKLVLLAMAYGEQIGTESLERELSEKRAVIETLLRVTDEMAKERGKA